ncbi:hypothetical protein B0H10DRAFT_2246481 [Mycena sp. CBHHK59/15]|nr:hypothetical protein B0H10DRAFT_2246481 [Mycena sp. CBHHK59/15]
MSLAPNPLHIPELVEHCIGLLAENLYGWPRRLALMSCALVARSWVNAAQSALLRAPHITNHLLLDEDRSERLLVLFHETLHNFPHLTHHIRDLSLDVIVDCLITQTTLDNVCALPFTHLESVSLFLRKDLDYESALQQLFSHPTLLRIKLDTPVSNLLFFCGDLEPMFAKDPGLAPAGPCVSGGWRYTPASPKAASASLFLALHPHAAALLQA